MKLLNINFARAMAPALIALPGLAGCNDSLRSTGPAANPPPSAKNVVPPVQTVPPRTRSKSPTRKSRSADREAAFTSTCPPVPAAKGCTSTWGAATA